MCKTVVRSALPFFSSSFFFLAWHTCHCNKDHQAQYFVISFYYCDCHLRSQLLKKKNTQKTLVSIFLQMNVLIWMKFSMFPQPVGLLKLMLHLFCSSNIQRREICCRNFMKCMFSIIMCQDTCQVICFKPGMMLSITKFYSLIPV